MSSNRNQLRKQHITRRANEWTSCVTYNMYRDIYRPPKSKLGVRNEEPRKAFELTRWVLLVPAVVFSWLAVFLFGGILALRLGAFDQDVKILLYLILGAISAVLVLMMGCWVAPRKKYLVEKCICFFGVSISLAIIASHISSARLSPFLYCALSAVIAGGFNTFFLKGKSHITNSKAPACGSDVE